ncbi:MAG: hypothetical protein GF329_15120 [Candidatus Lokiarchaeota archaeon]|nr:hypothetical protein [Candidatus Lokiarchaeota archaeon]
MIDFKENIIIELLQNRFSNDLIMLSKLRRSLEKNGFDNNVLKSIKDIKNKINIELQKKFKNNHFDIQLNKNSNNEKDFVFYYLEYWHAFFNDKYKIKPISDRGFDICIGNPPYFTEVRGYKDTFRIYKKSPAIKDYYEQKMDIFYFFIERGLDLVRYNGYVGFIIMDYWKTRTFGGKLRKKIVKDSEILKIVDFNEFTVFKDAQGQHNSILILKKKKIKDIRDKYKIDYTSIKDGELSDRKVIDALLKNNNKDGIVNKYLTIKQDSGKIRFEDASTIKILDKMGKKRNYEILDRKINQGLVIPQNAIRKYHFKKIKMNETNIDIGDGIFVISEVEKRELGLTESERNFLKPFYSAENLDSYFYEQLEGKKRNWILYITKPFIKYDKNEINSIFDRKIDNKEALKRILPELKKDYPNIINHLNKFQSIITSDKKPYGLHRPRKSEIFETPNKIISVRKTNHPKFAPVPIKYYMDQSVYFIQIDHKSILNYLVGLWNSKLSFFYFKKSKTHGNQLQIDKSVLKTFPICISDRYQLKVNKIVEKIIELKNANDKSAIDKINNLINSLDAIFFKVYEITSDEQEYIFDFLNIKRSDREIVKKISKDLDTIDDLEIFMMYQS